MDKWYHPILLNGCNYLFMLGLKLIRVDKWGPDAYTIRWYTSLNHIKQKQGKSEGFDSCNRPSNLTQIGFKSSILGPSDLEIWWVTPKNNKARLLYNIKLGVLFHIHQWIQTGVTVRKRPIWVKLDDFLSCVTLEFDVWPLKIIGHLFYATSSFVHHFVAIGEFKLELQSGNSQFGSKSMIFLTVWPWIWRMTLKNNRAPLLFYFKLCASFVAIGVFKLELQSGNAQFGTDSTIFKAVWPCNLTDDLEKQ